MATCPPLILGAVLLAASSAHAATINVPGDQPTIQAGIIAAVNGNVVIVAEGEYFENINFNGKAITVRSTDPNNAGVVMATIINGGGSGSVVTCGSSEGSDTVLSGFVITNGNASNGGGMHNLFSSPTVTNCTFSGNSAGQHGGGMSSFAGSQTVTNCTFTMNSAEQRGGGMFNNTSNPTVTDCSFSGNTAATLGGGMTNFKQPDTDQHRLLQQHARCDRWRLHRRRWHLPAVLPAPSARDPDPRSLPG